jgi:hypothetical protein
VRRVSFVLIGSQLPSVPWSTFIVSNRSEGPQPHSIDLTFPKKVMVSVSLSYVLLCSWHRLLIIATPTTSDLLAPFSLSLASHRRYKQPARTATLAQSVHVNLSHPQDDSYTPSLISIQAGTGLHDLQEVGGCYSNERAA